MSIIIPVYNEILYVDNLYESIVEQTWDLSRIELIFVDGGSTDGTVDRLKALAEDFRQRSNGGDAKVLDNPNRIVPHALNIGVTESSGAIIVRLDAHCEYASDYLETIVKTLELTDADIVGGPTRVRHRNLFQRAVGKAICSRFAVGGSRVHQLEYRGPFRQCYFWRVAKRGVCKGGILRY